MATGALQHNGVAGPQPELDAATARWATRFATECGLSAGTLLVTKALMCRQERQGHESDSEDGGDAGDAACAEGERGAQAAAARSSNACSTSRVTTTTTAAAAAAAGPAAAGPAAAGPAAAAAPAGPACGGGCGSARTASERQAALRDAKRRVVARQRCHAHIRRLCAAAAAEGDGRGGRTSAIVAVYGGGKLRIVYEGCMSRCRKAQAAFEKQVAPAAELFEREWRAAHPHRPGGPERATIRFYEAVDDDDDEADWEEEEGGEDEEGGDSEWEEEEEEQAGAAGGSDSEGDGAERGHYRNDAEEDGMQWVE